MGQMLWCRTKKYPLCPPMFGAANTHRAADEAPGDDRPASAAVSDQFTHAACCKCENMPQVVFTFKSSSWTDVLYMPNYRVRQGLITSRLAYKETPRIDPQTKSTLNSTHSLPKMHS